MSRTDDNNNPTAFTTAIAVEAGLQLGIDYETGDPFTSAGMQYFTARLLGDPIETTIRVLDSIGFRTKGGHTRWIYIMIPKFLWLPCSYNMKRDVIGFMYQQEGGTAMKDLFPNYGKV